jgi:hypothetical protein
MLGAELREAYPVVPLAEEHALAIGMFSYRDHMCFGLYADPDALPEVDRLPGFLDAEIRGLAGPPPRRRRGPVTSPAASSARLRVQR